MDWDGRFWRLRGHAMRVRTWRVSWMRRSNFAGDPVDFCLDTLEYLYRGGRIGNARRLLGTMLNLKPLIEVNHDKGIVEPAGRQ